MAAVPIVRHHVCNGCEPTWRDDARTLDAFLDWLAARGFASAVDAAVDASVRRGPASGSGTSTLQNASLEACRRAAPTCFQLGRPAPTYVPRRTRRTPAPAHARRESTSPPARTATASSSPVRGHRRLRPGRHRGPQLRCGLRFKGSWPAGAPVKISVALRGHRRLGVLDGLTGVRTVASVWQHAVFTTPAVLSGSTAISFGLSLPAVGNDQGGRPLTRTDLRTVHAGNDVALRATSSARFSCAPPAFPDPQ